MYRKFLVRKLLCHRKFRTVFNCRTWLCFQGSINRNRLGGRECGWLFGQPQVTRHLDHAAYVPKALEYQIPVYGNKDVVEKYTNVHILTQNYRYSIGKFKVQCIKVPHNALCYSFIIKCPSGEKMLFATDLSKFNYKVSGCDVIMMEANYDENIIYEALARGEVVRSQSENHLEINDCLEAVERCVDTNTQLIILLHLSDGYSDEKRFQKIVHEATGKRVCVAHAGQVYEINESDF